jgi:hypothetical protein
MSRHLFKNSLFALALSLAIFTARPASAEPLTVGYSDWPGKSPSTRAGSRKPAST